MEQIPEAEMQNLHIVGLQAKFLVASILHFGMPSAIQSVVLCCSVMFYLSDIVHQVTPAILSKVQLQSCANYCACAKLVDEITLLSEQLNEALKCLDPEAYSSHLALTEKLWDIHPHAHAHATINMLLFKADL